jgi:hypothetical protein
LCIVDVAATLSASLNREPLVSRNTLAFIYLYVLCDEMYMVMCPCADQAEQPGEQSRIYPPGGHGFCNMILAIIGAALQVYFRAGTVRRDLMRSGTW